MDIIFLIGRVLFGGYFLFAAWNHFSQSEMLAGYAASKKVPSARTAVIFSGILLLIGGLGVLLGFATPFALLALLVFLVPVTFIMHAFWKDTDPAARMTNMLQFQKNIALIGAVLMMFSITVWPYSIF